MAPGCRTIFMVMSADRNYSFEKTVHFSWGSLSTLRVTASQLKGMIRLLPSNPLWADLCVTVGNLTTCLFSVLWRHFKNIWNVLWTNIGCILSFPWTKTFTTTVGLWFYLIMLFQINNLPHPGSSHEIMKWLRSQKGRFTGCDRWPNVVFMVGIQSSQIIF